MARYDLDKNQAPMCYTVLNVDDTEASRYVKSRILRSAGYRVVEAGTGEEALRLARQMKPELVLLDVNLPGIDGLQVCQLLRNDPTTASMMILLDSAVRVRLEDRVVGLEGGADAYLLEPVAPDELLATVKALLRLYRSEQQLKTFAEQLEQMVARRTGELVHSQARLRALTTELNLAEQRERKRLAEELHDHLAQMIVLGRLNLSRAKCIAGVPSACIELITRAEEILAESLTYTRTLVADLAPPVLHEFGLATALKWLAEYMRRYQLAVAVDLRDEERLQLPEDRAILLFQSVRELLLNVSKHAGSAEAQVTLERCNGDLRIIVRDQGKGFDPSVVAAVNADEATSVSPKFGLFSIRERMRALGGAFEIQSSPGCGTQATLVLPLSNSGLAMNASISAQSSAGATQAPPPGINIQNSALLSTKVRVLLVDDHAMVRQGLRSLLESYDDVDIVGEASNGEEALSTTELWRPAIVVMDINMPKKNGIEATAEIKARWPDIIVIGLSVNPGSANSIAMEKAGATLLLTKEAAVAQLYQAIRKALAVNEETRNNVKC